MIDYDCSACEELRTDAPNFVVNGLGSTEETSLMNNTGLNPSSGNDDCEDLNAMNDCLVKNMEVEINSYNVCSWKDYMKALVGNLWTMNKGIISAICGLWTKLDCTMNNVKNMANALARTTSGASFVRYCRDNYGAIGVDSPYFWNVTLHSQHNLDIYMNCDGDNLGNQEADRDYLVIMSACLDMHDADSMEIDTTLYSSGDTDPLVDIRRRRGQHPSVHIVSAISNFSWPISSAVFVKKGCHLKINCYCSSVNPTSGKTPHFQLHQITLSWIPVNVDSGFDPSTVIVDC